MFSLEGKVALITGAASGIGKGTVDVLIQHGAKVTGFDIQPDKGHAMMSQYGDAFHYVNVDVTDDGAMADGFAQALKRYGRLDILFNNAGAAEHVGSHPFSLDTFDRVQRLLLRSVLAGVRLAVPEMVKVGGGSIINTASIAGQQAGYGPLAYSVAKAGVIHMTRALAAQLSRHKIRINAICPGLIATSIFGRATGDSIAAADQRAEMIAQVGAFFQPLPKSGLPEDIGNAVLFFASDYASFVTGQALAVDGGITVGPRSAWDLEQSKAMWAMMGIDDALVESLMQGVLRPE